MRGCPQFSFRIPKKKTTQNYQCIKPGLHIRRKHKHKHKHKHKDVYTCDKHKHNVTYASAEPAEIMIPTWRKMATHE